MELPAMLKLKIEALATELQNVKEYDDTKTTLVLVAEMSDSTTHAIVLRNGILEERPLHDVAEKVRQFSAASAASKIRNRDEAEEGRKKGFIW